MSETQYNQVAKIKVFGVGGAGCNAINRMVDEGLLGVDFYVANTDFAFALHRGFTSDFRIRTGTQPFGGFTSEDDFIVDGGNIKDLDIRIGYVEVNA